MKKKEHLIRYFALGILFCAFCVLYTGRLLYLQVAGQDYYTMATPTVYYTRTEPIQAFRGEIYDRNGTPLVTNQYTYNLQLDYGSFPKKEADKKAAAKKAKEKEKALKRQKRVDKINHYRAISGQAPIGLDGKPKDGKNKKK